MILRTLFSVFYNRSKSSGRSTLDRASEAAVLTVITIAPVVWGLLMVGQAYLATKFDSVPLAVPKPLAWFLAFLGLAVYSMLSFRGPAYAQGRTLELKKPISRLLFVAWCIAFSVTLLTSGVYVVSRMVAAGYK